jgi:hypothetical protein
MSYFQRLGDMNYMAEEAEMVDFVDEIDGGAAAGVEDVEANEYDLVFFSTYFLVVLVYLFLWMSILFQVEFTKLINLEFLVKNEQLTKATDTSSGHARNGQDIQGIPWERLNITREKYRLTRLEQYKNYENIPLSGKAVDKVL